MNTVFALLSFQALLGAFDNLWHHEWEAKLPQRVSALRELRLHAAREALYALLFIGLAWFEWHGLFAGLLAGVLGAELCITLADFLEEDRTRRLPPFERWLHTVLTVSYGLFIGLFAPIAWAWWQQPSALVFHSHGWVSALFTLYGLGVGAWSLRNARAVRRLGAMAAAELPQPDLLAPAVLVAGATGFVGQALVAALRHEGRRVIALSRDGRQARALFDRGVWVVERLDDIPAETRIEAVVNLAGARVLGLPWTAARRRELLWSRARIAADLLMLMRRLQQAPKVLVAASAVGYYGACNDGAPQHEDAEPRVDEFQAELCAAVEHEARRAEGLGLRVVRLRLGVVLGRGDGAYPPQALAARLGLGAVLGTGSQPAPWIHLDDAVGLIRFALNEPKLEGAVNACAPQAADQAGFARALAASFGRQVRLRMPGAPLRRLAGEMSTLLLDGQHAPPCKALAAGYRFRHASLDSALVDLAR